MSRIDTICGEYLSLGSEKAINFGDLPMMPSREILAIRVVIRTISEAIGDITG